MIFIDFQKFSTGHGRHTVRTPPAAARLWLLPIAIAYYLGLLLLLLCLGLGIAYCLLLFPIAIAIAYCYSQAAGIGGGRSPPQLPIAIAYYIT